MAARAKVLSDSIQRAPARANRSAKTIDPAPARVSPDAMPSLHTPARAIASSVPTDLAPARANATAASNADAPARARVETNSISSTPARSIRRPNTKSSPPARATVPAIPKAESPARDDLLGSIRTLGRVLDDLEHVRKQNGNRIGALERSHGSALPSLGVVQDGLAGVEHEAVLALQRMWRKHPLAEWQKRTLGLGEKLLARLIAEIGDPYIASPHHWHEGTLIIDAPYARTVSQLWQYCGHGNPHLKRRKGMTQEEAFLLGKTRAKSIVHLISEGLIKARNPEYRAVYDAARANVAEKNHEAACPQCHAKAGDPWRPGHQHAHALRLVGKEFLRDLWLEARAAQGEPELQSRSARAGQLVTDTQKRHVRAGHSSCEPQRCDARAGETKP